MVIRIFEKWLSFCPLLFCVYLDEKGLDTGWGCALPPPSSAVRVILLIIYSLSPMHLLPPSFLLALQTEVLHTTLGVCHGVYPFVL